MEQNLNLYHIFVTVARCRNISGAARALYISPVFRRSTRKVPVFSSSHFFTFSPEPRLFLYLRHIFNALWGLFLLKIFLEYSIIMVLYGTLLGEELWRTFYDRKKRKKDSICKCMTPTGTRR